MEPICRAVPGTCRVVPRTCGVVPGTCRRRSEDLRVVPGTCRVVPGTVASFRGPVALFRGPVALFRGPVALFRGPVALFPKDLSRSLPGTCGICSCPVFEHLHPWQQREIDSGPIIQDMILARDGSSSQLDARWAPVESAVVALRAQTPLRFCHSPSSFFYCLPCLVGAGARRAKKPLPVHRRSRVPHLRNLATSEGELGFGEDRLRLAWSQAHHPKIDLREATIGRACTISEAGLVPNSIASGPDPGSAALQFCVRNWTQEEHSGIPMVTFSCRER
jgi:hypothetical protein